MKSFASFQIKLFALVFGVAVLIVGGMTTQFVMAAGSSRGLSLERKTAGYARVLARELEPALAFDDRETAREDFEAVATDPDVRAIALYDAGGRVKFSHGVFALPAPGPLADPPATGVTRRSAPVSAREGARGWVVVELSTAGVVRQRVGELRNALLVGALAIIAGLVGAWLIARSVGKRVGSIAAATRAVAAGELSSPVLDDDSPDELGQLSRSFGRMVTEIRSLLDRLKRQASEEQVRLKQQVAERTAELDRKQGDLQLVLDTVGDGFVLLDKQGRITEARAAIFESWFGAVEGAPVFADFMAASDANFATWFGLGFEELISGELPVDAIVAQLPAAFSRGARRFQVRYRPVVVASRAELLVMSIADVTAEIERARIDGEQKEMLAVFQRAISDRAGVFDFLEEVASLVASLSADPAPPRPAIFRAAHTIKGTAASFGLDSVATAAHAFETALVDAGAGDVDLARAGLLATWAFADKRLRALLGESSLRVEILPAEIERVRVATREGRPKGEILALLDELELEPATRRLDRLAPPARALATRLGKPAPDVRIAGDARVDGECLRGVWAALTHAVRNAVDHGLESASQRFRAGKSPQGRLTFTAFEVAGGVEITIEDDGRGVDWVRVAERARAAGRPAESRRDLEEALFVDGISTRDEADEISGRGVGMSALRAEVERLGGRIEIRSTPGTGTAVVVRLPTAPRRETSAGQRGSLTQFPSGPFG